MGNEATKLRNRWQADGTFDTYFYGRTLDIGCGQDKIVPWADGYDKEQGNGQLLADDETVLTIPFSPHTSSNT